MSDNIIDASTQTKMTQLPGDICPAWCGGIHHPLRGSHPDDDGVRHASIDLDLWCAMDGDAFDSHATRVWIDGFRHDSGNEDGWHDMVEAVNVSPGFMGGISLQVKDARRLGEALIAACELYDGGAA